MLIGIRPVNCYSFSNRALLQCGVVNPKPQPGGPGAVFAWSLPQKLSGLVGPASMALGITETHILLHHSMVKIQH